MEFRGRKAGVSPSQPPPALFEDFAGEEACAFEDDDAFVETRLPAPPRCEIVMATSGAYTAAILALQNIFCGIHLTLIAKTLAPGSDT